MGEIVESVEGGRPWELLRHSGAMGQAIAAADWSSCPLGSPAHWPEALRANLALAFGVQMPMFIAWGPDHSTLYNAAAAELLGDHHPTALGTPMRSILPDIEPVLDEIVDKVSRGQSVLKEGHPVALSSRPGEAHWANMSATPIPGEDGEISGICLLYRDVTSQILRERQAIDSERHYRTLFDRMDEGFCVIEFIDGPHGPMSDYVHIEANAAYAANAGIPNVVGKRLREIVGDEADEWLRKYRPVCETGEPIRFEQELVATGRHLSLSAFRLEPPERRHVAVLFLDVTARRAAEIELRELNRTLEARVSAALAERKILADIVEGTNAFIQVCDMSFNWLAINRASVIEFERIYGIRPRVGDNLLDVLADKPDAQATVRSLWQRAIDGEEFVEISALGDADRDRRQYEMRFGVLRDADGLQIGAYQFVYDVTERLAEQDRLREAEDALRQAQKMEAVGQLTGGLAHDFNNLLAGVSGAFEMIGVRLAQGRSAEIEKYLMAGQGAARRAAALTHRLLAFARRQTLAPKPIVINRLLPDFIELVRRTVGPAIAVETIAATGLWPCLVDSNQLENAMLNLCINARDAMPNGGRITIETGNKWMDERTAREQGLAAGQYVTMCVSDTGSGIEKSILNRVFDPFFTTKPIGEGTGLGLSMVYGFARQSNGHVRIYSEVEQGTMVCIYLPRYFGEEEPDEDGGRHSLPAPETNARVLIVDDEPTVRMLVVDALADRGYACIEAADGPTGLQLLEADNNIDLLITDVGLPGGMNGRQVAEAARALQPGIKVLFITGYAENAVLNHGHVERGMEVLTKPFAIDELAGRVDRLLHADHS